MNHPDHPRAPYEEGFLATLLLLACGGLLWLFRPFLPGLFLAILLAASTYPLYEKLRARFRLTLEQGALVMTGGVFLLVVSPLLYLLIASGLRVAQGVAQLRQWLAGFDSHAALLAAANARLAALPIPAALREQGVAWVLDHKGELGARGMQGVMFLFQSLSDNSLAFLSSLILTVFALFFFYRDGPDLVQRLKVLTPLPNRYDDIILHRFGALAAVLTLSTVGIALLQGLSFSLVTAFMGLPWFYLGVALAVTSFIPVVGGVIVWAPLAYFLYWTGHPLQSLLVLVWGAVVIGFIIDNLFRPVLIRWLSALQPPGPAGGDLNVLSHTLLTVLATFGGLLAFGIMGLFFGPMMAAMAITVFDVYQLRNQDWLDHS